MEIVVACYIFSVMILCLAGLIWVRAQRLARSSRATVERIKLNHQLSRGSRDARSRMWVQRMQQKGQRKGERRGTNNRFRPTPAYARKKGILEKVQQVFRKRKEILLKAFGGPK